MPAKEKPARVLKPRTTPNRRECWSQRVTETSNALDLEPGVFTLRDPRQIALSLKTSAEQSRRRKADPFRSAMSMLSFYINRAGWQLPAGQRACLEAAKDELRLLFGKPCHRRERLGSGQD
ncbi:protein of unknown function [Georgfuchsia toluolica]|uniref:DUF3175 domain-containing protein n=1 Tax=Georgfuchsia toluolica TaxID=424218 RepID=A0A916J5Q6_9PROT|nr:DUF3175 domain-containing protein [Georgfuchsia toluolica]CAG4884420.1 protein of unknown function [Georgfuchsia toluolica]